MFTINSFFYGKSCLEPGLLTLIVYFNSKEVFHYWQIIAFPHFSDLSADRSSNLHFWCGLV